MSFEAESGNQNTSTVSEPIEVNGGDSMISWDDLDSVQKLDNGGSDKATKTKSKDSKEDDEPKGSKEKTKEKGDSDGKEEKSKSKSEEVVSKEKGEADKTSPRLIKLKNGDQDVELRSDSLVEVKVDGKVQKVTLQDALNGFSGARHLQEQHTKIKEEKATFEKSRGDLNYAVNHIHDLIVNKGDARGAIQYLAEATGGDPIKIWQETVSKIEAAMEETQKLSPEERRQKALEEENQWLRGKEDKRTQESQKARDAEAVQKQVNDLQQKHGVSNSELVEAFDALVGAGKDPTSLTAEEVVSHAESLKVGSKVREYLSTVGADPENLDKYTDELKKMALENKDLSEQDLREIALQVYGKESARRLSKKVTKMENKHIERNVKKTAGSSTTFFDDLDG
jgi:hypothetical protein